MLAGKLHLRVSACRNGKPHLLVRIGNTRGNFLLHPEVGTFALPPSNGIKEERHFLTQQCWIQQAQTCSTCG